MAIVGTLPVTLANGTTADASQVMSDLNFIANQVNANAVPTTGGTPTLSSLTVTGTSTLTGAVTTASAMAISSAAQLNLTVTSSGGSSYARFANGGGGLGKYVGSIGNNFAVVNNANTTVLLTIDDSGNLVATGNITANSDERLKNDWAPLAEDFIEKLAKVKSGTFTRTATKERNAGVSAQSLQEILPEAVHKNPDDPDGYLSVAYGNAALVACIELAKEVQRLRALLEPAK
jgi:hypothetical protein